MKNLLSVKDITRDEILKLTSLSEKIKKSPHNYSDRLRGKSLLMMFAKPSLRTHLSFDLAMYKLGGHAIFYDLSHSTLGEKESIKDFSKVISRYVDIIMARLFEHKDILELSKHSNVPVINGLTNAYHPCQVLGDLLTIKEKYGKLNGLKLTYLGDANNNVTHDLIIGCSKVGIQVTISCPDSNEFKPDINYVNVNEFKLLSNPENAVRDADVIYTDTWMSYHVKPEQEKERVKFLKPYSVTETLMKDTNNAIFMHCLPAKRGQEVTDGVMDSKRSVIYDQAENRMWSEMAILLTLLTH